MSTTTDTEVPIRQRRHDAEQKIRHAIELIDDAHPDIRDGVRLMIPILLTYLLKTSVRAAQVDEIEACIQWETQAEDGADERFWQRRSTAAFDAILVPALTDDLPAMPPCEGGA